MNVSAVAAEAARRRHELREEQERHRRTRAVLDEANTMLLALWLRGRLVDPSDFDAWIGKGNVIDRAGRIDWVRLSASVDDLLARKPHLGAPEGNPWSIGTTAIEWFLDGAD